uniref:Uncharacterized protein n=1 Tax=Aegilops tauschii subsp. strangulata TaxID=200361 RepID=A0A453KYG5_AEGTS
GGHLYPSQPPRARPPLSPPTLCPSPPTAGGGDDGNMVQRLTYRKRHSYATKSNQTRVVKTPGPDPLLLPFPRRFSRMLWSLLICSCQDLR